MARPTADALVLHFLYTVQEAHLDRITRYMESQWRHPPGTTRNALWRLSNAGLIERIGYMRYRRDRALIAWVDVTPAELETKPAPLTTQRSEYYTEG